MSTAVGRPALKLKLSSLSTEPTAIEPSPASGAKKLTIKFGSISSAKPTTPVEAPAPAAKKEKKPRKPKTAKAPANGASPSTGSKKRTKALQEEDDDNDDVVELTKPQIKRLKLTSKGPVTPIIRAKLKGKPPPRPLGVGYDSESSDREVDPAIEEEFILRMAPGEDCDYLRKAIEDKNLGLPRREGGADVSIRFFNRDGRKAVISIKGRHYAATMVDLPCVIEGMKSWDRRGWWKSADICQMLFVTGQVDTEDMALTASLPPQTDPKTYQYPHGLTPPMHFVRKRRFRKRISNKTIEAVEDEVERLLAEDATCEPGTSRYEMLDLDRMTRENSVTQSDQGGFNMLGNAGMQDAEYDQDAEGEIDDTGYFDDYDQEDGKDLEADLEKAMRMDNENDIPSATTTATTPATAGPGGLNGVPTPSAAGETGDETSDEDAEDEEAPEEIDEDALERQRELQRQKEEIADLENAIKNETVKLERLTNVHLREKLVLKIRSLRADLDLKRGAAGLEEE